MDTITKTFFDVEHEGDIQEITDVINSNNGEVLNREFNYDAEQVTIIWQVPDRKAFWEAVKGTYYFD